MKTVRRSEGFSPLIIIIALLVISLIGVSGYAVTHSRKTDVQPDVSAKVSQKDDKPIAPTKQQSTSSDSAISASDMALVENLNLAPADGRPAILAVAKDNVKNCPTEETHKTHIYNATDIFIYYGSGCDSGYRGILKNNGTSWTSIYHGQSYPDCSLVDTYAIPKSLLYESDVPDSDKCYDAGSKQLKTIPY